jgi:hypothetical protein
MGVVTPAAYQASTPLRTSAALPKSVTSASQRSLMIEAILSGSPARAACRIACISSW